MPNFIDYSNPLPDLPDEDSPHEQATRLLRDIRELRESYQNKSLDSLSWIMARRSCVREAEFLGCTEELLLLMAPRN